MIDFMIDKISEFVKDKGKEEGSNMSTVKMEPIEINLPQDIIFAMRGLEKNKKRGKTVLTNPSTLTLHPRANMAYHTPVS